MSCLTGKEGDAFLLQAHLMICVIDFLLILISRPLTLFVVLALRGLSFHTGLLVFIHQNIRIIQDTSEHVFLSNNTTGYMFR